MIPLGFLQRGPKVLMDLTLRSLGQVKDFISRVGRVKCFAHKYYELSWVILMGRVKTLPTPYLIKDTNPQHIWHAIEDICASSSE